MKPSEGAPEKGPFTMEVIRESLQAERLRDTSLLREEDGSEWVSLRELVRMEEDAREVKRVQAARIVDVKDELYRRRKATNRIILGCVALGAGALLTFMSYDGAPSKGGRYYVFRGLIVVGIAELIRGFAARKAPPAPGKSDD